MAHYPVWTPRRAARVGFLAGQGMTLGAIAADLKSSPLSIRNVLSRWHVPVSHGAVLPLAPEDRSRLEHAARQRGISTDALVLRLLHTIFADGLVGAILDDGE